jgi:poly-gamma-glutamate synthesis protein (capsule biosynthesis protein)
MASAKCGCVSMVNLLDADAASLVQELKPARAEPDREAVGSGTDDARRREASMVTLFLCGDVMTGRGVDQILKFPGTPELHESYVHDARDYVALAEQASGPIPRSVEPAYVWGDALAELDTVAPGARVVNLETSVTRSDEYWEDKGIYYRMHPANIACLTAAQIDVCALANNHVLDYGYAGLEETVATLGKAGLKTAGAGANVAEAQRPAIVELPGGRRVVVVSLGSATSGIPPGWSATETQPGVDLLRNLSDRSADDVLDRVRRVEQPGDVVVASIHWGSNWGYEVPRAHVRFAHRLIDGGVDVVHGHSSHHPRPIEVYRNKLVLYGCGDFIDDYEGIGSYEDFKADLVLMYFAVVESSGLVRLRMTPMRIQRMRLNRAAPAEAAWLRARLSEISAPFGCRVESAADGSLVLRWDTAV